MRITEVVDGAHGQTEFIIEGSRECSEGEGESMEVVMAEGAEKLVPSAPLKRLVYKPLLPEPTMLWVDGCLTPALTHPLFIDGAAAQEAMEGVASSSGAGSSLPAAGWGHGRKGRARSPAERADACDDEAEHADDEADDETGPSSVTRCHSERRDSGDAGLSPGHSAAQERALLDASMDGLHQPGLQPGGSPAGMRVAAPRDSPTTLSKRASAQSSKHSSEKARLAELNSKERRDNDLHSLSARF
jgi:hypothetical protein